jgi:prevent-host-death family protein
MVADFKSQFSDVLGKVRNGEEVVLEYGRRREKVAVLVPYEKYRRLTSRKKKRQAGTLAGKGEIIFSKDFKMTDEEFLGV